MLAEGVTRAQEPAQWVPGSGDVTAGGGRQQEAQAVEGVRDGWEGQKGHHSTSSALWALPSSYRQ